MIETSSSNLTVGKWKNSFCPPTYLLWLASDLWTLFSIVHLLFTWGTGVVFASRCCFSDWLIRWLELQLWYPLEFWAKGPRFTFSNSNQVPGSLRFRLAATLLVIFPWSEFRIQFLILKSPNWKENDPTFPVENSLKKTHRELKLLCIKLLLLLTYLYLIYNRN